MAAHFKHQISRTPLRYGHDLVQRQAAFTANVCQAGLEIHLVGLHHRVKGLLAGRNRVCLKVDVANLVHIYLHRIGEDCDRIRATKIGHILLEVGNRGP